jgi:hypothetical protein
LPALQKPRILDPAGMSFTQPICWLHYAEKPRLLYGGR